MRNVIRGSSERIYTKGPLAVEYNPPEPRRAEEGFIDPIFDVLASYYRNDPLFSEWMECLRRNAAWYGRKDEPICRNAVEIARNVSDGRKRYEFVRKCASEKGFNPKTGEFDEKVFGPAMMNEIRKISDFIERFGYRWKEIVSNGKRILFLYERPETECEVPLMLADYDYVAAVLFSSVRIWSRSDLTKEAEAIGMLEKHWRLADGVLSTCGKKTALRPDSAGFWDRLTKEVSGDGKPV